MFSTVLEIIIYFNLLLYNYVHFYYNILYVFKVIGKNISSFELSYTYCVKC